MEPAVFLTYIEFLGISKSSKFDPPPGPSVEDNTLICEAKGESFESKYFSYSFLSRLFSAGKGQGKACKVLTVQGSGSLNRLVDTQLSISQLMGERYTSDPVIILSSSLTWESESLVLVSSLGTEYKQFSWGIPKAAVV